MYTQKLRIIKKRLNNLISMSYNTSNSISKTKWYHGSSARFDTMKKLGPSRNTVYRNGVFLTDNIIVASIYAMKDEINGYLYEASVSDIEVNKHVTEKFSKPGDFINTENDVSDDYNTLFVNQLDSAYVGYNIIESLLNSEIPERDILNALIKYYKGDVTILNIRPDDLDAIIFDKIYNIKYISLSSLNNSKPAEMFIINFLMKIANSHTGNNPYDKSQNEYSITYNQIMKYKPSESLKSFISLYKNITKINDMNNRFFYIEKCPIDVDINLVENKIKELFQINYKLDIDDKYLESDQYLKVTI
jgi:hypothetical protein